MFARNRSLSTQVIAILIAVATIILMTYAVATTLIYREREMTKLHNKLHVSGAQLQTALAAALWNYDTTQLDKVLDGGMKDIALRGIVVSSAGKVFARSRDERWEPLAKEPTAAQAGDVTYELPVTYSGQKLGTLMLIATTRYLNDELVTSACYFGGSILLLDLLLVFSLFGIFRRTVISPLKQLETYAVEVSSGVAPSMSLGTLAFNGEIEVLRTSLAKMVALLESRYAELHQYRDQLEVMVKERTAELEVAVSSLSIARNTADAANQAKSIFLANMSHEIRTPMNAVLGFAQLLERDTSLSPQAHNKVATIMKSGDHLLAIINDILEMSRIEAGRVEVRPEPIDLHALLDDLAVMFRLRAEGKGLVFNLYSAPELPRYIIADLGKLRQVLINLLGNAVKFTKNGTVTMRALSAGIDRIAIEVQDSGIGITREEQEKLFHPFERTRSGEQAAGGTGLGLAISREYAHLMDGEITVESRSGEGSLFRFDFHAPVTAVVPLSSEVSQRVTGLLPGQGEVVVLVVDDQSTNRELLREMMTPLGFVVAEAADGNEAVEKALALKPRIILMDLVMPGMDGGEATRILRRSFDKESLAVIGITASTFEKEKQQFIDSGINAFIAKPFREQELYDVLAEHAAVLFETETVEVRALTPPNLEYPVLDKMSSEWLDEFRQALARKSITRIRRLGEEAKEVNAPLAAWLLDRAGLYDLASLKKLIESN